MKTSTPHDSGQTSLQRTTLRHDLTHPSARKRLLFFLLADVLIITFSLFLSYLVHFEFNLNIRYPGLVQELLLYFIIIKISVFVHLQGLQDHLAVCGDLRSGQYLSGPVHCRTGAAGAEFALWDSPGSGHQGAFEADLFCRRGGFLRLDLCLAGVEAALSGGDSGKGADPAGGKIPSSSGRATPGR